MTIKNFPTNPKNGGIPASDKNKNTKLLVKNVVCVKYLKLLKLFKKEVFKEKSNKKKKSKVKI